MFAQTFVVPQTRVRRPFLMAASLALQTIAVSLALLTPLLRPQLLSPDELRVRPPQPAFTRVALAVQPAAAQQPTAAISTATRVFREFFERPLTAPATVPQAVRMAGDAPEITAGYPPASGGHPGAGTFSTLIALPDEARGALPSEKTKPNLREAAGGPITVGTGVQSAKLLFGPKPAYPPLARAARVSGTVRLRAFIATDGGVRNVQLVSGPPLLVRAAYDAVLQWRYKPTLLNGVPVEVLTEVDVNFTLSQ